MANNRLWAVCKADNECVVLLKNYSVWYCVNTEEYLDTFFESHKEHKGNEGCGENIVFVTEVDDDPRVKLYDFSKRPPKIYLD